MYPIPNQTQIFSVGSTPIPPMDIAVLPSGEIEGIIMTGEAFFSLNSQYIFIYGCYLKEFFAVDLWFL